MEYSYLINKPQNIENASLFVDDEAKEFDTEYTTENSQVTIKIVYDESKEFETDIVLGEENLNIIKPQIPAEIQSNRYIVLSKNLPENCSLTVDGEEKEFDTEYQTEAAEISVVIVRDGYNSYEEKIALSTELVEIEPVMEPIKHKVTVNVDEDAVVIINGIETRELNVNDGDYVKVEMTKENCYPITRENQEIHEDWVVTANFFLINYELTILVKDSQSLENITPDAIYIDDVLVENTKMLPTGTYRIKIVKDGYETLEGEIQISDDNKTIIAKLNPIEHTVKVQTANEYTVMFNDEVSEEREIKVLHGRELKIDVTGTGKEPFTRTSQILSDENLSIELEDIAHHLLFSNLDSFEKIILLNLTTGNGVEYTDITEPIVIRENNQYHFGVEMTGYRPYEVKFNCIDSDVILTIEKFKPTLCLTVVNSESQQIPAIIHANDKIINNGESVIFDYGEHISLKIECDGYQLISSEFDIFDGYYETLIMTELNPEELDLTIKVINNTGIDADINLMVDDEFMVLPDSNEITIPVVEGTSKRIKIYNDVNSVDISDEILVTEPMTKTYTLEAIKFNLKVNLIPEDGTVTINGIEANELQVPGLNEITIKAKADNFEDYSDIFVMPMEDKEISIVLQISPDADLNDEDIYNVSFEDICKMLRFKKLYNYIYIGHIFQERGVNEESVKDFYYLFAPYLADRFDIYIWYCMKHYYGIIDENQVLARPL